jgi:hypothetical protein
MAEMVADRALNDSFPERANMENDYRRQQASSSSDWIVHNGQSYHKNDVIDQVANLEAFRAANAPEEDLVEDARPKQIRRTDLGFYPRYHDKWDDQEMDEQYIHDITPALYVNTDIDVPTYDDDLTPFSDPQDTDEEDMAEDVDWENNNVSEYEQYVFPAGPINDPNRPFKRHQLQPPHHQGWNKKKTFKSRNSERLKHKRYNKHKDFVRLYNDIPNLQLSRFRPQLKRNAKKQVQYDYTKKKKN